MIFVFSYVILKKTIFVPRERHGKDTVMKKFLAIILCAVMIGAAFAGCSPSTPGGGPEHTLDGGMSPGGGSGNEGTPTDGNKVPQNINAADITRLLLAGERLDSKLLRKEGDIFDDGAEALANLISIAEKNLANSTYVPLAKEYAYQNGSKVTVDGKNYVWSGFAEYNNSLDTFETTTNGIIENAKRGADLIDMVKKNVRVVDKWVKHGNLLYLHVEENSETLLSYDETVNTLDICHRYINEDGKNVYELYYGAEDNGVRSRMFYIPGERYEMSIANNSPEYGESLSVFVADNKKGYWEVYSVNEAPEHYNVSCFMLKDDICYDAFYDPKEGNYGLMKIMSADRKTALLNIHAGNFELQLSGFDGVKNVEINAESVSDVPGADAEVSLFTDSQGKLVAQTFGFGSPFVNLENGKTLMPGEYYANGKVQFERVLVTYIGEEFGYMGEISLRLFGETHEEKLEILKEFLDETGLKCRRDIDDTLAAINKAYADCDVFVKYYTLNGFPVDTEENIAAALAKEDDKFDRLYAMYEEAKDAETVEFESVEQFELYMSFADVTDKKLTSVSVQDMILTVEGLELTVEDTLLFVENEPYSLRLGLVGKSGMVHLEIENDTSAEYKKADSFTVTAQSIKAKLPVIPGGEYRLVAYIATSDGIRSSGYTTVNGKSAGELMAEKIDSISVSVKADSNGDIGVVYTPDVDISVSYEHSAEKALTYTELYDLIAKEAFAHGTPGTRVEMLNAETGDYSELSPDTEAVPSGVYRVSYTAENAKLSSGNIVMTYTFTQE